MQTWQQRVNDWFQRAVANLLDVFWAGTAGQDKDAEVHLRSGLALLQRTRETLVSLCPGVSEARSQVSGAGGPESAANRHDGLASSGATELTFEQWLREQMAAETRNGTFLVSPRDDGSLKLVLVNRLSQLSNWKVYGGTVTEEDA